MPYCCDREGQSPRGVWEDEHIFFSFLAVAFIWSGFGDSTIILGTACGTNSFEQA